MDNNLACLEILLCCILCKNHENSLTTNEETYCCCCCCCDDDDPKIDGDKNEPLIPEKKKYEVPTLPDPIYIPNSN